MLAGVLKILTMVAPPLFRFVESKFKPKTGATKMTTVLNAIKALLEPLATAGELGGAVPSDNELLQLLEQLLTQEKAKADWKETAILELEGRKLIVQIIGEV